jgi:hypothetical protein
MNMTVAIALALVLVAATVTIYYEMLRGTLLLIPRLSIPPRSRILVVIGDVFVAHLLEICLYAFVLFLMHVHFSLESIAGEFQGGALDFFYFSITSYTMLGVGDLFPHGPLRIVAGIETLNGFILIGWSASFTYLSMEKF